MTIELSTTNTLSLLLVNIELSTTNTLSLLLVAVELSTTNTFSLLQVETEDLQSLYYASRITRYISIRRYPIFCYFSSHQDELSSWIPPVIYKNKYQ